MNQDYMQSLGNGNDNVVPRDGTEALPDAGPLTERIQDKGELRTSSLMVGLSIVYASPLSLWLVVSLLPRA